MKIRQANKTDAEALARLVLSAAPVALSAIFDINSELTALNFLHSSLLIPDGQYGYENHWVAEIDNQVVGCLSAWHSDLPNSFHQATFSNLVYFYGVTHSMYVVQASQSLQDCIPKPKEHEWCFGHFAVLAQHQKQGIGSALLTLVHKQALTSGKSALSLDVEAANKQVTNFYQRQGFVVMSGSSVSPRMQALGIGQHLHLSKDLHSG